MLTIDLICIGRMKGHDFAEAFEAYRRMVPAKINVYELDGRSHKEEIEKINAKLSAQAALIVMDETGKNFSSREFADRLNQIQVMGHSHIQFVIGGADGLTDNIRSRANLILSLGRLTWPHMMARVMLIEQIYRALQILAGHPYHRD